MPTDHYHLTATRTVKEGQFTTLYIVRAASVETEIELLREMGYTVGVESCLDKDHLASEPEQRQ